MAAVAVQVGGGDGGLLLRFEQQEVGALDGVWGHGLQRDRISVVVVADGSGHTQLPELFASG